MSFAQSQELMHAHHRSFVPHNSVQAALLVTLGKTEECRMPNANAG